MNYAVYLFVTILMVCSNLMTFTHAEIVPGFYIEWPEHKGLPTMIAVNKLLERQQSPFQTIAIYETETFGNMMVIDDVIMLTQRDNHGYHEMIAHVPLMAHPHPQTVLIVGGGDGGTLKEVLKHSSVKEVILCEIDMHVIALSKQYFPEFASAFDDRRVTIVDKDATDYIKTIQNYFDVICVDSTDPIGPGEALFKPTFYRDLHTALSADGIAVTQSEPHFLYTDLVAALYNQNRQLFAYADYYYTLVPTYPSGTIGFSFCSKKYNPFEHLNAQRIVSLPHLQYYNEAIHRASFALPEYLKKRLT